MKVRIKGMDGSEPRHVSHRLSGYGSDAVSSPQAALKSSSKKALSSCFLRKELGLQPLHKHGISTYLGTYTHVYVYSTCTNKNLCTFLFICACVRLTFILELRPSFWHLGPRKRSQDSPTRPGLASEGPSSAWSERGPSRPREAHATQIKHKSAMTSKTQDL